MYKFFFEKKLQFSRIFRMQTEHSQTANEEYSILNKDIELCGQYFDVVPDGNLYTIDDMPIFAIRMRASDIQINTLYIQTIQDKYTIHNKTRC